MKEIESHQNETIHPDNVSVDLWEGKFWQNIWLALLESLHLVLREIQDPPSPKMEIWQELLFKK